MIIFQGDPESLIITPQSFAALLGGSFQLLLIDCRSFLEFNTSCIRGAINVCCSRLVRKRLQQGKLSIDDLIASGSPGGARTPPSPKSPPAGEASASGGAESSGVQAAKGPEPDLVVVYDQCSDRPPIEAGDSSFLMLLMQRLVRQYKAVRLLQ
uniref:Rhodanese domain-containing protein n=1 Tax=Macrostomum lignano TaxID=282301 RepID=A0A1I8J5B3_9PLAT